MFLFVYQGVPVAWPARRVCRCCPFPPLKTPGYCLSSEAWLYGVMRSGLRPAVPVARGSVHGHAMLQSHALGRDASRLSCPLSGHACNRQALFPPGGSEVLTGPSATGIAPENEKRRCPRLTRHSAACSGGRPFVTFSPRAERSVRSRGKPGVPLWASAACALQCGRPSCPETPCRG